MSKSDVIEIEGTGIRKMKQSFFFSKCVLSVIVIALNYILSKKMVFHKQRENGVADESIQ